MIRVKAAAAKMALEAPQEILFRRAQGTLGASAFTRKREQRHGNAEVQPGAPWQTGINSAIDRRDVT